MKKIVSTRLLILGSLVFFVGAQEITEGGDSPVTPCINCHKTETPGIVKDWEKSKHSKVGVKCYVCHMARKGDPSGYEHEGFQITAVPSPKYCATCHSKAVEENSKSKHAWAAFMGPLRKWPREPSLPSFRTAESSKKLAFSTIRNTTTTT